MDNQNEYNPDIITIEDEDGKIHNFEVLDTLDLDNERYVALLPVYDEATEIIDDDGELIILKVVNEDREDVLLTIEDDDEFEKVANIFEENLSDLFEIEVEE